MESYLVKADRGRANREAGAFDMSYWVERNFSQVEDRSILAMDCAGLRAELLADPLLGPLHQTSVHWRKRRFGIVVCLLVGGETSQSRRSRGNPAESMARRVRCAKRCGEIAFRRP